MQRLGRNNGSYLGETIDIAAVLRDCVANASSHGWQVEELPASPKPDLVTCTRPALRPQTRPLRVYLSSGIHGDEPAGPLAARQLLQENRWPAHLELWMCPCLNRTGFPLNRRENEDGLDLNRDYLRPKASETLAHIAWLGRQPRFDVCFCLHEDWESLGFYVYELNPDRRPSLAEPMVERVAAVCPIDPSEEIEDRPAQGGIIRPSIDPASRPLWPEAFYLLNHKTRVSYTLEAPSDFPLATRVAALVTAVQAALEALGRWP